MRSEEKQKMLRGELYLASDSVLAEERRKARRLLHRMNVEMLGGTPFPPIGTLPYFFTVGPHNFFWFDLVPASEQAEEKLRRLQAGDKK